MVFTGDTHTHMRGKGVLQEIERRQDSDFSSVMKPITKRTWRVDSVKQLPSILRRAWIEMMHGRKGPVVISLPMDVQADAIEVDPKTLKVDKTFATPQPDPAGIADALKLMTDAKRPMILAGGGVLHTGASDALLKLAELWGAPTMTTLAGKSAFPESHPLSAWLGGSKGTGIGNVLAPKADVLLAVGVRFADETASSYRQGATYDMGPTKLIHIDIDPDEIGKNYPAKVGVVGDAGVSLNALAMGLTERGFTSDYAKGAYYKEVQKVKRQWFAKVRKVQNKKTSPITISAMLKEVREALPKDTIVAHCSGNTQAQILQEFPFDVPGTCLTTGGFSTMGWALPAALGAKLGNPDTPVVGIVGDGDFMMTMQEMAAAVQHKIPIVMIVANNCGWLAIRDLQMAAFGEDRGHMVDFAESKTLPATPDFVMAAKAFGWWGKKVSQPGQVAAAVKLALKQNAPALVEVTVNRRFPISGGDATGWWDVPVPTYLKSRRAKYKKERDDELL
jgi:acetolactate synthase-1/2/3 large subunit